MGEAFKEVMNLVIGASGVLAIGSILVGGTLLVSALLYDKFRPR